MKISSCARRIQNRISSKLHSSSGVTILLALLLFLAATMVSIVIISSAVSSVQRVTDDHERNQSMETLISAAQMIKEEMDGLSITITTVTKDDTPVVTYAAEDDTRMLGKLMEDCMQRADQLPGTEYILAAPVFQVKTSVEEMEPVEITEMKIEKVESTEGDASSEYMYKASMKLAIAERAEYSTSIEMKATLPYQPETITDTGEDGVITEETTAIWIWNVLYISGAPRSSEE